MGKKCICQICSCGKHRCPHNLNNASRVINKSSMDNCKVSEYGNAFHKLKSQQRGPFYHPRDLLVPKGEVDYGTIHTHDFISHPLEQRRIREPEKYIPSSGKMDVDSEYHAHFLGETATPARRPSYLKSVTQLIPSGKMQDATTNRNDYRKYSAVSRSLPVFNSRRYSPPKSPFTATTLHRADFQRFNEPPQPTARQPDKINMKGQPMSLDTSHKVEFKRHSIYRKCEVKRKDDYCPPCKPFDSDSLMHSDYIFHLSPRKAEIHKPIDTVLRSDQPMEKQTTNLEDYKNWPVETVKPKTAQSYEKPQGEMNLKPTSSDYKNFGTLAIPAKSARPKTKLRTGRDGSFNGVSNYASDFKTWESMPALPIKMNDELTKLGNENFVSTTTSEQREEYKRHNTAPARIFKPGTSVFKTDEVMSNRTVYKSNYDGRTGPSCLSDKLLKGEIKGVTFQDDEDTGHRYIVGSISLNNIHKDALPSISDTSAAAITSPTSNGTLIGAGIAGSMERNQITTVA